MANKNKSSKSKPAIVPTAAPAPIIAYPPAKNPTLFAVSVLLFALWFIFLLVAAIWNG